MPLEVFNEYVRFWYYFIDQKRFS